MPKESGGIELNYKPKYKIGQSVLIIDDNIFGSKYKGKIAKVVSIKCVTNIPYPFYLLEGIALYWPESVLENAPSIDEIISYVKNETDLNISVKRKT